MQDLIASYRASIKETKEALDVRKKFFEDDFSEDPDENDTLRKEFAKKHGLEKYYTMHSFALSEDIQILRSMLNSMRLSLSMMNKEAKVRARIGIQRRAKSEREIPVEPARIYRRQDRDIELHEADEEQLKNEKEVAEHKERLVGSMTEVLTDRQKEILELAAAGYTHKEIAEQLSIAEGTVSSTLTKSKEKIRNEGWLMV